MILYIHCTLDYAYYPHAYGIMKLMILFASLLHVKVKLVLQK